MEYKKLRWTASSLLPVDNFACVKPKRMIPAITILTETAPPVTPPTSNLIHFRDLKILKWSLFSSLSEYARCDWSI